MLNNVKISKFFLFVCTASLLTAGLAYSQQGLIYDKLNSKACNDKFEDIAYNIFSDQDTNKDKVKQAIVFYEASNQLGETSNEIIPPLIRNLAKYSIEGHGDLMLDLLINQLYKKSDSKLIQTCISYIINQQPTREGRELFLTHLYQSTKGKNNALDSQVLISLGILREQTSDPNIFSIYTNAYFTDKFNRTAMAKMVEFSKEEISPYVKMEHLRLNQVENPLDLSTAYAYADTTRKLGFYNLAQTSFKYCQDLHKYLYPKQPLPAYIYMPRTLAAYNSKRSKHICLQIYENLNTQSTFDLFASAIAAKAAIDLGENELAETIKKNLERKAKAIYYDSENTKQNISKSQVCQGLTWYYCFIQPNPANAHEWANNAYTLDPNSPMAGATLAYALFMNNQNEQAEKMAQKYPQNQIANMTMGLIEIQKGLAETGTEKLQKAIAIDPGSIEIQAAKDKLTELNLPPQEIDETASIEALAKQTTVGLVPEFLTPQEIIQLQLNTSGSTFNYGKDFGTSIAIKNLSSEPLLITDNALFTGHFRIDAKLTGDIKMDIPKLVDLHYQPTAPLKSRVTQLIKIKLYTAKLKEILENHPQAAIGIEFTLYLDPVQIDNKIQNKLADIKPIVFRVARLSTPITTRILKQRINSFTKGQVEQKLNTVKLFAGLLKEKQDLQSHKFRYKHVSAEWMPSLLKSIIKKAIQDQDWQVRTLTMTQIIGIELDQELLAAVAKNLNDEHWPVRLMAVYLLASENYNFQQVLNWKAKYDTNPFVRQLATAMGAKLTNEDPQDQQKGLNFSLPQQDDVYNPPAIQNNNNTAIQNNNIVENQKNPQPNKSAIETTNLPGENQKITDTTADIAPKPQKPATQQGLDWREKIKNAFDKQ